MAQNILNIFILLQFSARHIAANLFIVIRVNDIDAAVSGEITVKDFERAVRVLNSVWTVFTPVCCHQVGISVSVKISRSNALPEPIVAVETEPGCPFGKPAAAIFKKFQRTPLRSENQILLTAVIVIDKKGPGHQPDIIQNSLVFCVVNQCPIVVSKEARIGIIRILPRFEPSADEQINPPIPGIICSRKRPGC